MYPKIAHSATISGIFRHFEAIFSPITAILCPKFIAKITDFAAECT